MDLSLFSILEIFSHISDEALGIACWTVTSFFSRLEFLELLDGLEPVFLQTYTFPKLLTLIINNGKIILPCFVMRLI